MKIAYLGAGIWGYTLADLLADKGYHVTCWSVDKALVSHLRTEREHPRLPGRKASATLTFTTDLAEALAQADMIVEGVTSAGVREVFSQVSEIGIPECPIVLTSKGIEQNTGLFLSDVVVAVLGETLRCRVGCVSGPSLAPEVFRRLPTSVVCSAYDNTVMQYIHSIFSAPTLRIYPNLDIRGVELGGAMKNVIAIACGAASGLNCGDNARAALMTRGLHEMRRLAAVMGCQPETLNGLAGMGDLCVTCLPPSRNYRFGQLIAQGRTPEEAKKEIGMVVEGAYSCLSAVQIAEKQSIELPISQAVYRVVYEHIPPQEVVKLLLQRSTKHEGL